MSSEEEKVSVVIAIAATTIINENTTAEENNQGAILEGGTTIKSPHSQYCWQQTVKEREAKGASRTANKTKAR